MNVLEPQKLNKMIKNIISHKMNVHFKVFRIFSRR